MGEPDGSPAALENGVPIRAGGASPLDSIVYRVNE